MGLHLYCIVPAGLKPPAGTAGVGGAMVGAVRCGELSCWTSAHEQRPAADTAALQSHNAVIHAGLTPAVTPVPLRFGQWLADAAAVRRSITADGAAWLALLDRFAGHAEWGLSVSPAGPVEAARVVHPDRSLTGKEYMAALAHRQAAAAHWRGQAEQIAAELLGSAAGLVGDSRVELPGSASSRFSLAHLVAWRNFDAYHDVVARIRRSHGELRFLCTGPWPPYSFVA